MRDAREMLRDLEPWDFDATMRRLQAQCRSPGAPRGVPNLRARPRADLATQDERARRAATARAARSSKAIGRSSTMTMRRDPGRLLRLRSQSGAPVATWLGRA